MSQDTELDRDNAPDPDDSRKPDSPGDLQKRTKKFVLRKTMREFSKDQCTDLAAGLTYYGVLAVFPAAIALISLLGVFGQGPSTITALLDILRDVGAGSAADTLQPTLETLSQSQGAGIALIVGLLGALWSASGYVGVFGRSMNTIYAVGEGRPVWKLRPVMLLLTFVMIALIAVAAVLLVVSGPLAQSIGSLIGLGSTAVLVWNIAKWPVLLVIVILIVALLYNFTPNVKQPKFRWTSVGAVTAILTLIVATALFGFYVANFSSYNKTYGALAGVIVFLLWIWITNLSLLFGAELDAELERGRELQAGIDAEEYVQLPLRDTKNIEKRVKKEENDRDAAEAIRKDRG